MNSISGMEFAVQNHVLIIVSNGLTSRRDEQYIYCNIQEGMSWRVKGDSVEAAESL